MRDHQTSKRNAGSPIDVVVNAKAQQPNNALVRFRGGEKPPPCQDAAGYVQNFGSVGRRFIRTK